MKPLSFTISAVQCICPCYEGCRICASPAKSFPASILPSLQLQSKFSRLDSFPARVLIILRNYIALQSPVQALANCAALQSPVQNMSESILAAPIGCISASQFPIQRGKWNQRKGSLAALFCPAGLLWVKTWFSKRGHLHRWKCRFYQLGTISANCRALQRSLTLIRLEKPTSVSDVEKTGPGTTKWIIMLARIAGECLPVQCSSQMKAAQRKQFNMIYQIYLCREAV